MTLPRLIVFDFDGTLVDSAAIKKEAFYQSGLKFGFEAEWVKKALEAGGDRYDVMRRLSNAQSGNPNSQSQSAKLFNDLVLEYSRISKEEISLCRETPGLIKCLSTLKKKGIKLFINSATPADALLAITKQRNLHIYFDGIYGRPDSKVENLNRAMKETDCSAAETVMVGDGTEDADAANEINCKFIAVNCWSNTQFATKSQPFAFIDTLSDLPIILTGN